VVNNAIHFRLVIFNSSSQVLLRGSKEKQHTSTICSLNMERKERLDVLNEDLKISYKKFLNAQIK